MFFLQRSATLGSQTWKTLCLAFSTCHAKSSCSPIHPPLLLWDSKCCGCYLPSRLFLGVFIKKNRNKMNQLPGTPATLCKWGQFLPTASKCKAVKGWSRVPLVGKEPALFSSGAIPLPHPALEPADTLIPISLACAGGAMLPKGGLLHKAYFKWAQRRQKEETHPVSSLCLDFSFSQR